jgi:uncharacterized protein YraI
MFKHKLFLSVCTSLIVLTAGCQPIIVPATPVTADSTDTTSSTTITTTTPLTETVMVSETVALTETVAETTATGPALTVVVASLRVRSGPGTEYTVLGAAAQGEQFPIIGQANDCQWFQVTHPQYGTAWMSGGAQYVSSDASCDQIPEAAIPAAPTVAPTVAAPAPTATTASAAAPAAEQPTSTPAPTPTPAPAQSSDDPFPPELGCLLLQNQLGPELTFTFTGDNYNDTIKVSSAQDVPYCLPPGRYRVTVDAPPPWSVINEEFTLQAGERAYFPIRPQE